MHRNFHNLRNNLHCLTLLNTTRQHTIAKPFLKWAGGKTQLLTAIEAHLPPQMALIPGLTYIEPFIGSGAVFFWFIQKFKIKKAVINDINPDLINVYEIIRSMPDQLIAILDSMEKNYFKFNSEEDKKAFFIEIRTKFNLKTAEKIENAAYFIFLNRTCFNGLYRVNSSGLFNVPFGRYAKPKISDPVNILKISKLLENVIILNGDYQETLKHADQNSFFYLDPPYKPISKTASFNTYTNGNFNDEQQIRLAEFTDLISQKNYRWLLSNSDPKNTEPENSFFDKLFHNPANTMVRVRARRMINSNPSKRGAINEILIMNYKK